MFNTIIFISNNSDQKKEEKVKENIKEHFKKTVNFLEYFKNILENKNTDNIEFAFSIEFDDDFDNNCTELKNSLEKGKNIQDIKNSLISMMSNELKLIKDYIDYKKKILKDMENNDENFHIKAYLKEIVLAMIKNKECIKNSESPGDLEIAKIGLRKKLLEKLLTNKLSKKIEMEEAEELCRNAAEEIVKDLQKSSENDYISSELYITEDIFSLNFEKDNLKFSIKITKSYDGNYSIKSVVNSLLKDKKYQLNFGKDNDLRIFEFNKNKEKNTTEKKEIKTPEEFEKIVKNLSIDEKFTSCNKKRYYIDLSLKIVFSIGLILIIFYIVYLFLKNKNKDTYDLSKINKSIQEEETLVNKNT